MKKALKFPIGESDFASLRQGNYHYVDKSLFIQQIVEDGAKTLLFPRPRRFGKTLNLSMLRYFFEKPKAAKEPSVEERRALFSGLQIEASQEAWEHFAKYPMIFITFKDVKANSWAEAWEGICLLLSRLYQEHRYVLESNVLNEEAQEFFLSMLKQKATPGQAATALFSLSQYLQDYHKEKVMIFIDEYDTCMHEAYAKGYYDEAIVFFRNLLSGAFKDNSALHKGVMTGILRIAKESLFSGLNNLSVYSLLHHKFATSFGFTEEEVIDLVKQVARSAPFSQLKFWYNGYLFGGKTIYNPWSILNYLTQPEEGLKPYWVNTGQNQLLRKLLLEQGLPIRADVETLLQGGSISKPIDENIAFVELEWSEEAIWSFLLFAGYLKAEFVYEENEKTYAKLSVVNYEIKRDFTNLVQAWFEKELYGSMSVKALLEALFTGNGKQVEEALGKLLLVHMSYYDFKSKKDTKKQKTVAGKKATKSIGKHGEEDSTEEEESPKEHEEENEIGQKEEQAAQKSAPEAVYHAFVMGLLVNLIDTYQVKSNPESGFGRADVLLIPKVAGKPGVVLEFKVAEKATKLKAALKEALLQLEQRQYPTELMERGAIPIYEYAVAFCGKQVLVQSKLQSLKK